MPDPNEVSEGKALATAKVQFSMLDALLKLSQILYEFQEKN